MTPMEDIDLDLCLYLRDLPSIYGKRYTDAAKVNLLRTLFLALAGCNDEYFNLFFPNGPPAKDEPWSLRVAQGAVEGAEYTLAAKGHRCGHIFKSGEATYRCKTCSVDDTCVLCARCFDASDHEDHTVYVSISVGNSGCCDCGDPEAWNRPIYCNIHTDASQPQSKSAGKAKEGSSLPEELLQSIRSTIAKALNYLCDVFSCSPEQLRLAKSEISVREDERLSRLTSSWYGGGSNNEEDDEFALVLWNDEKHTVHDVRDQVARACKKKKSFGLEKAHEVNDIGRAIIEYSTDLKELLRMAKVIEEIKVTVTIRSARDTFREQMCATIIEWISDISGCTVGNDHDVLRNMICEEMLREWRMGSEGSNAMIGKHGLYDHETEDLYHELRFSGRLVVGANINIGGDDNGDDSEEDEDEDQDEDDFEGSEDGGGGDEMEVDDEPRLEGDNDLDMDVSDEPEDYTETSEATYAGYPPPPPPPPPPPVPRRRDRRPRTLESSDAAPIETQGIQIEPFMDVPKTPKAKAKSLRPPRPPSYWLEKPEGFSRKNTGPVHEDLWQRVRLDYLILYDLRMWKKLRIDLRDLYITTVVTIPYFKRILGLRFAGLYTPLAQLYLIADREPDHSIIMLSLQMLTTPSITAEVVERGNFLTNLMAILYTFLTTRQVGYPSEINSIATLAFEAGAVTNRRMYHFFQDMKYLFASECVKERLCLEERYLLQYLDLVKLHQGICPNVRAVGEHLEYETDAWISASLITREINRLCRQISDAFQWTKDRDDTYICRAIRRTAKVAIFNSMGCERRRFTQAEIKRETRFKKVDGYCFDETSKGSRSRLGPQYTVVEFDVSKEPMSFHHALHYTLSWLIEKGKSMDVQQLYGLLVFSVHQLKEGQVAPKVGIPEHPPENYLLALFDFPLRVCAWLAQMRAGLWVRNGITLRHQMSQYRGVIQRDVSYQRDIFLLQAALVICPPETLLASMIERFGLYQWMKGNYQDISGYEDHQVIDIAEDFIHLLIILLSDRNSLIPLEDESKPQLLTIRRDIAHALCFKPLSFSELTNRLPERVQDSDDFPDVLVEMTNFRPPEGMSDSGTFELKEQYIEDIDPYSSQYSRNQREEAENIYKAYVARKTGKQPADVVFMPKLRPIKSGVFTHLATFTQVPLIAQVIYFFLGYALAADRGDVNVPMTRVEGYVQFVLQLILLAVHEDRTQEDRLPEDFTHSFVDFALYVKPNRSIEPHRTIVSIMQALCDIEAFKPCVPKINRIFDLIKQKQPRKFASTMQVMGHLLKRQDDASPAPLSSEEREQKKKQALERQARVMAQFKEQQMNFMENQAIDWGEDDLSDMEDYPDTPTSEQDRTWKYPSGTCILCQEETNDQRIFGTFGFIAESSILRQTDLDDEDWVAEVASTPTSLDRSADAIRPFGVAGQNRRKVQKVRSDGTVVVSERQELGKGFPASCARRGPVTTGCGHIMHFSCFEVYLNATQRRHANQIARNHPERLECNEFLCPLCKALGNVFLPIIWKAKTVWTTKDMILATPFDEWLESTVSVQVSRLDKNPDRAWSEHPTAIKKYHRIFLSALEALIPSLSSALTDFSHPSLSPPRTHTPHGPHPRVPQLIFLPFPPEDPRERPFGYQEARPSNSQQSPLDELIAIYQRLRQTIMTNSLPTQQKASLHANALDFTHADVLVRSLGYTISAFEIAQRGVESDWGAIFLDKVSGQYLTHLRILSDTVNSYFNVGGYLHQGSSSGVQNYFETQHRHMHQLFAGHPQVFDQDRLPLELKSIEPLFSQDVFIFLVESCTFLVPALHTDVQHFIRLCYMAELVKFIVAIFENPKGVLRQAAHAEQENRGQASDATAEESSNFAEFVRYIAQVCPDAVARPDSEGNLVTALAGENQSYLNKYLHILTSSYALPFVRKVALLLYARFDVEFPATFAHDSNATELARLSDAVGLPPLDEIFASFVADTPAGAVSRSLASGWIRHWTWVREGKVHSLGPYLSLSHPAIFELVGLPRNYDTLTDEAIRRRCQTTGKELTDPCVCLFCGQIFCSQGVCCMKNKNKGGCWQHMEECCAPAGIFLHIRKCMVLFLHGTHGSWTQAPYLDRHGEPDPTLRRHHQLFLNQRRYDVLLRSAWLHHSIPSAIARRLEGEINNGGWETL